MMLSPYLSLAAWAGALVLPVVAQFPPTPQGVTVVKSKFNPEISISYKEVSALHMQPRWNQK